ncbi:MAG: outer membrane beta-barrel domain-containing protein [Bermanella sp.]
MNKVFPFFIVWVFSVVLIQSAQAKNAFDKETVTVVQERIYDRTHEIGFNLGYVPDDDFYEEYPLSLSYTYHFNKNIAWEVGRFQYFLTRKKDLKDTLSGYDLAAVSFDKPLYMLHTSFVLKPTYGKDAVWDSSIVNHEGFFSFGAGIAQYQREYPVDTETSTETVLSVTLGAGRRYFVSKKIALITEIKTYTQFKDSTTETNIYLGLGIAYRFNFSNRNSSVREKTDSVYRYLNDDEE